MTLNELIKELTKLQSVYGEQEVYVHSCEYSTVIVDVEVNSTSWDGYIPEGCIALWPRNF